MSDKKYNVESTSAYTADVSPIQLSRTDRVNLCFKPVMVNNNKDNLKCIKGKLIFEKKKECDDFFPSEINDNEKLITRKNFKASDWMEISFDTEETINLFSGLKDLYNLYIEKGIKYGNHYYEEINSNEKKALDLLRNNDSLIEELLKNNDNLISKILEKYTNGDIEKLLSVISKLDSENIDNLNYSVNVDRLIRVCKKFEENINNDNEEFWQNEVFTKNQWILSQVFLCPYTFFKGKAYVGGKNIDNSNGNIVDFIYKNNLSKNTALVEIKTPKTKLIGRKYRNNSYCISDELSGAITQVLSYKHSLSCEINILRNSDSEYEAFNPKCVILIGTLNDLNIDEKRSFELFRNSYKDIEILTYDELLCRINNLTKLISS